jgi:Copper chaperone
MKKLFLAIIAASIFTFVANGANHSEMNKVEKVNTSHSVMANTGTEKHGMLKVEGNCKLCKMRIEAAAKSVKGVSTANWDVEKKMLHLNYDAAQTDMNAISKAVAKAGHDTEKNKANQKAYDSLPGCCKYRK